MSGFIDGGVLNGGSTLAGRVLAVLLIFKIFLIAFNVSANQSFSAGKVNV